ncbi:porin [Caballeronia cordobensis]|uniref:Porin n=1 Tax=Caballeronia cordobensis TaxID=1353886 RepID=A0A158I617_CABCO|nr:porin [Caballeronia cordobensis]SAL51699.1 porin [Caballeronia cordobensis]
MRKALTLITCSLLASSAHAQSAVTLYGLVFEGFVYTSNQKGSSVFQTATALTNPSRWGLRGEEELGAGIKAVFTLENGFDPNNGKLSQGGRMFGRQAYVGLTGPFGGLTLGRQYEPVFEYIGLSSATAQWGFFGSHPGDFDNMNATARINNAIKYASPRLGGVAVEGVFAPGGTPGNFGNNRVYSFGVDYQTGPVKAAVAFANLNNPSVTAFDGSVSPGSPGYSSPVTSPVYRGYASAASLQIFGAAFTYKIGDGKVGLVYTNTRFVDIRPIAGIPYREPQVRFDSYEINSLYRLTPSLALAGSYDFTDADTARYHQVDLGAIYSLSKRTDLTLVGVWQRAEGIDSTGQKAVANITGLTASSNATQLAIRAMIAHRF